MDQRRLGRVSQPPLARPKARRCYRIAAENGREAAVDHRAARRLRAKAGIPESTRQSSERSHGGSATKDRCPETIEVNGERHQWLFIISEHRIALSTTLVRFATIPSLRPQR